MKLYPIHSLGIEAYCSDLVVDPDEHQKVYFMSVAGYEATVKGIMANVLEHYGISIEIEGMEYYLTRADFRYKTLMKKLPSGLAHGVLFPKLALTKSDEDNPDRFFVMTNKREELLPLFFRHLDERTEIPLHPSWDKWLWKTFEEQQDWMLEGKRLVGSYDGYLLEFNQKKLHDLVSEAIRDRVPDVTGCMEWKGGTFNGELDFD